MSSPCGRQRACTSVKVIVPHARMNVNFREISVFSFLFFTYFIIFLICVRGDEEDAEWHSDKRAIRNPAFAGSILTSAHVVNLF